MYQECSASSQNEKLITTSTDTFKGIIGIKDSSALMHNSLSYTIYTNKLKSAQDQVTEATTYNTSTTVEPLLMATPDRRPPTYYGHSPWVQNASPFTTMLQKPLIYGHLSTPYNGHYSWPQTMPINALQPLYYGQPYPPASSTYVT